MAAMVQTITQPAASSELSRARCTYRWVTGPTLARRRVHGSLRHARACRRRTHISLGTLTVIYQTEHNLGTASIPTLSLTRIALCINLRRSNGIFGRYAAQAWVYDSVNSCGSPVRDPLHCSARRLSQIDGPIDGPIGLMSRSLPYCFLHTSFTRIPVP